MRSWPPLPGIKLVSLEGLGETFFNIRSCCYLIAGLCRTSTEYVCVVARVPEFVYMYDERG